MFKRQSWHPNPSDRPRQTANRKTVRLQLQRGRFFVVDLNDIPVSRASKRTKRQRTCRQKGPIWLGASKHRHHLGRAMFSHLWIAFMGNVCTRLRWRSSWRSCPSRRGQWPAARARWSGARRWNARCPCTTLTAPPARAASTTTSSAAWPSSSTTRSARRSARAASPTPAPTPAPRPSWPSPQTRQRTGFGIEFQVLWAVEESDPCLHILS